MFKSVFAKNTGASVYGGYAAGPPVPNSLKAFCGMASGLRQDQYGSFSHAQVTPERMTFAGMPTARL